MTTPKDTDLREALRRKYASVPQLKKTSLQLPQEREQKHRAFPLHRWLYPISAIAACVALLIAFNYKNKVMPKQEPIVAEVVEPPAPENSKIAEFSDYSDKSEPLEPTKPIKPQKPVAREQTVPLPTSEELGEKPLTNHLLAENKPSPPKEQGEKSEPNEILPPDRQALVDIYLDEVALQVAYMQQEQMQELRAFNAGLQGKEPETSHLIIAF